MSDIGLSKAGENERQPRDRVRRGGESSDVSVIGAGAMGSALVDAFAASGARVTVWNRTEKKAKALEGPRVSVAGSPGDALRDSPITIVAVSDNELARHLIVEAGEDLQGKTVASASFATPDQASMFDESMRAMNGRYLDLSILGYPEDVRSGSAHLLISGDRASYDLHQKRLLHLGRVAYVGTTPGSAYMCEMAVLLAYMPMAVSFLQGVRLCERYDLSLDQFKQTVIELYPQRIRTLLERVVRMRGDTTEPEKVEASVRIWGEGVSEYAGFLRELELDSGMYDALERLFKAGVDAGRGEEDWTRIADMFTVR